MTQTFLLITDTAYASGLTAFVVLALMGVGVALVALAFMYVSRNALREVGIALGVILVFVPAVLFSDILYGPLSPGLGAETLERQVQAEGTVASVEEAPDGQAVTLRLAEEPSRSMEFAGLDREILTEWEGKTLTATCTGLDDPQALTECQMGEAPIKPEQAPDGRAVERSTEFYTD